MPINSTSSALVVDRGTIDYYNKRISSMELERSTFISHYQDLQEFISPRRGRFLEADRNKGNKRHKSIINSAATQALRIAVAGMLNGTMSPSRPWFALTTFNPDLMESQAVREWLYRVELILREILNQSNFYNMAPVFLKELLLFGTCLMTHVDDYQDVARFYTHTVGSYYLGQNSRLEIDTFGRDFEWPVRQVVEKFGLENCSRTVKDLYDKSNYESWIPLRHFVEPSGIKNPGKFGPSKKFQSVYYEPGNMGEDKRKFLRKSGFDTFPAYAVRWDVTEGDIYGVDCPGMTALGDVKQLQLEEKKKAQAIEKFVNPPLTGPPSVRNTSVSGLPGGLTVFDGDDTKQPLKPIYTVDPRLGELREDMGAVEDRIGKAFFNDLFLAISNMEGIQPRNQLDLSQRNEERLTQLGPVLERLHGDFLTKMLERSYAQADSANIIPPPPPEMDGEVLNIRFVSTLAMAQRNAVIQDIERVTQYVGAVAGFGKQDIIDKFNADQALDEYSRAIGIPPSVIVADPQVQEIRAQRAQQMQDQIMAQQGEQMSKTTKNLADASTGEGKAGNTVKKMLDGVMKQVEDGTGVGS